MEFDKEFFVTVAFTIIDVVVLFLILKKLLFKPVTKFMDDRSKKIEDALNMAEEAKKQVAEIKADYDAKLRLAKEEGNQIIEDYKKRADKEYEAAIETAKKEAELIVEKAKVELEVEKEQLVSELKKEMADLVLNASQKVIKENIDSESNRKLISDFIDSQAV